MPRKRSSFGGSFDNNLVGGFSDAIQKKPTRYELGIDDNPFKFTPKDFKTTSRIRYYDHDSTWVRWRRGYELYCLTQTLFSSKATGRNTRGDFRMYCAFQQFPGVFIPARMFMFPSTNNEIGEQMVGIRDANSFNFYNFGLPIDAVRYLTEEQTGTYSQSGTALTITVESHGYKTGDSLYLDPTSGAATPETLTITVTNANVFTATASASVTTTGNITVRKVTTFADPDWVQQRVRIRFIPTPVTFFGGERLADRVIERDPGLFSTYTRVGTTVTVTCSSAHGLSTGNEVFLAVLSGAAQSGLYEITVLSSTQFTVQNYTSGPSGGTLIVNRRLRGYNYENYVGYTVTGTDLNTNEILFQRDDSYGAVTANSRTDVVVPAPRGFQVGRYLTTEIRYQCTCTDFMRRENYDLYEEASKRRIPRTPITSVVEGTRIDRDGNVVNTKDDVGVFTDLLYISINNFYQLPTYEDTADSTYNNLMYYQMRWCKHIYAAMWSIFHDEGNDPIDINATYVQSGGPNITITAPNHGLGANTRIELDITSGNVTTGEYIITQVVDANTFLVVSPISLTTSGYCVVRNLRNHEYVKAWLYEPNDQPIGDALDKFYERFDKEFSAVREQLERMKMMGYGMPWSGSKSITGNRNQPTQVGDFDPQLVTMMATNTIRRDANGQLSRDGTPLNTAAMTLYMMQKLINIPIDLIDDAKFGMLDQPLTDYSSDFRFAEIDCGTYRNGVPTRTTTETLDCGTYLNGIRTAPPFVNIDCGVYITN